MTITAAGTYRISGSLSDGALVADTADEDVVQLILDGVDVTSSTGSAVEVVDASEVILELAEGSENMVTDAETYTPTGADAVVLATFTTTKDTAVIVVSSPDVVAGTQDEVVVGGQPAPDAVAGFAPGGDATGATALGPVTAD